MLELLLMAVCVLAAPIIAFVLSVVIPTLREIQTLLYVLFAPGPKMRKRKPRRRVSLEA